MLIEIDSERGKQLGFTSDRFDFGSYLWEEQDRIMVSLVSSKQKGNFKTLVDAIHSQRKSIAIPTPLGKMAELVRRNGYVHSIEEDQFMGPVNIWTLDPPNPEDAP